MDDNELIDGISALLKQAGFEDVAKRTSSRSVTLSGLQAHRSVVVHLAGPEPAAGVRAAVNPERLRQDSVRVRAGVPTEDNPSVASEGGPHMAAPTRKQSSSQ